MTGRMSSFVPRSRSSSAISRRPAASSRRTRHRSRKRRDSGRTWDYRYCWLRDAYFVVKALNRLGATQTMEDFISFILGIASEEVRSSGLQHRPCRPDGRGDRGTSARLSRRRRRCASAMPRGQSASTTPMAASSSPPCRCSSTAGCRGRAMPGCFIFWSGSASLAERSPSSPTPASGNIAVAARVHTHSAAMCWAGCNRLGRHRAASRLEGAGRALDQDVADGIQSRLLEQAWNEKRGAFTAGFGVDDLDASVLLLPEIGLIEVRRSSLRAHRRGYRARTFARQARYALRGRG